MCKIVFLLLMLFALSEAQARTVRRRPWFNYNVGGSYKSIAAYQSLNQENVFRENANYQTEQRLRLNIELSRGPWRIEIADQLSIFSQNANPAAIPLPPDRPASAWSAQQHPVDRDSLDILNRLDRAYVEFKRRSYELRIGKQVIAAGVGKIFQAISQTPRQAFIIANPEYPVTEDALIVQTKGAWNFEGRLLPKTPLDQSPSFHLVARGKHGGYDVALTGGRSNDKGFIGLETAGNLGDSLLRAEAVGYQTNGQGSFGQALIGVDRYFSDWSVQTEVFYNGFGAARKQDYVTHRVHRPTPYHGKFYVGASVDWTVHPLVETKFSAIFNLNDLSTLIHLSLSYSLSRNLELMAGQFLGLGGAASEFGGQLLLTPATASTPALRLGLPDMTYLLLKFYF